MRIIAETGVDMKAFLTASALVGWAGLRPRNDQSTGKIKGRKTFTWKQVSTCYAYTMRMGRL